MPHQPDERELFRLLGDDAQRAHLAAPDELRHRGDRRTATRAATAVVAAAAVVAGIVVGSDVVSGSTTTPPPAQTATPALTPTATPPPTPTEPAPPAEVPGTLWLDEGDLRFPMKAAAEPDLPTPCGQDLLPVQVDGSAVLSSGTRWGSYLAADLPADHGPDGTISQTVVVFAEDEAAQRAMAHLHQVVDECPEDSAAAHEGWSYTTVELPTHMGQPRPDGLLVVQVKMPGVDLGGGDPNPAHVVTYVSVVNVGNAVTLLTMRGWEASNTHLPDVWRLTMRTVERLVDWHA